MTVLEPDRRTVVNRQRTVRVARRPLEAFLRRIQNEVGYPEAGVTVCLVSDAEMARLNETYRKKKGPTDVLSFPASQRHTHARLGQAFTVRRKREYLGDIAISTATAQRNARKQGRSLPCELRVLILHGVLHLLGYDHETDRGEMDRIERKLRRRFGLA